MIETSDEYKSAIYGDVRQIVPMVNINTVDPDIQYGEAGCSGKAAYADLPQIHDGEALGSDRYATLEAGRWALDGSMYILPDSESEITGQRGYISDNLSDAEGNVSAWVQLNVSNLAVLQAASVYFPANDHDGCAADFVLDIYSGETVVYSEAVTGNTSMRKSFEGFTANNVTAIRVTVSKWSMPYRRVRVIEIVPGLREKWYSDMIYSVDVLQQADFSGLSLPYGTASVEVLNEDRRFSPEKRDGLLRSITERSRVEIRMGAKPGGAPLYVPMGVYYFKSGGWATGNRGLTIKWAMVDIVGLLSGRKYEVPGTLPQTLAGWMQSIVSQLGSKFADQYTVGSTLGDTALTCTAEDIQDITCGNLLRFLGQAAGAYFRADPRTGKLMCEVLPAGTAATVTLDELSDLPEISANTDLARITFKLAGKEEYNVAGNNAAGDKTVSVDNPFIRTEAAADAAVKGILANYGGNRFSTKGRGNMAAEVGDIEVLELAEGVEVAARRYKQQFRLINGILKDAQSDYIQADGTQLFDKLAVITESGTWKSPAGCTIRLLILVGGGTGGTAGSNVTANGKRGEDGSGGTGGKVLIQPVEIAGGAEYPVTIGAGGTGGQTPGESGTAGGNTTAFGYSSAAGTSSAAGYADIWSGLAVGVSGEAGNGKAAADGTGNGGGGGKGGRPAMYAYGGILGSARTGGKPGASGGSGCVIVYYTEDEA